MINIHGLFSASLEVCKNNGLNVYINFYWIEIDNTENTRGLGNIGRENRSCFKSMNKVVMGMLCRREGRCYRNYKENMIIHHI